MNFFKRPDSQYWWFQFRLDGKRHQKSSGELNRRKAENVAASYRSNLIQTQRLGFTEKKPVPTFSAATKEFLDWSAQHHASKLSTHTRYVTSSKALLKTFGKSRLDGISPEDVERFKVARANHISPKTGRKICPATVNRELACLKIVCNYFIRLDVIVKNPVSRVKFLAENNEQTRVLSFEEQRLYLLAAPQPLRDVAALMLETGCRPEEIYRSQKEDVNFASGYLLIPKGKTKAARRKIPLTANAAELLRRRIAESSGSFLFPHRFDEDKPILKVNWQHHQAVSKSQVKPFRLYDCRHTYASRLAMSGVDLVTLASLLGHSKIQMVMRYAHPSQEHQFEAVRKLEQFTARKGLKVA